MTTQIKAGVIAANAVNSSELASGALSGQTFTGDVIFSGTTQGTRLGLGVAPHATAGLNITTTNQHMRLNNGSELGIIHVLSTGELELWGHGDGESINFRTGSGTGTVAMNIVGNKVGIGTTSPAKTLHLAAASSVIRLEDTDGGYGEVSGSNGNIRLRADEGNTQASSFMSFDIDSTEEMRLTSTGLGIGTTSPANNLHIHTNAGDEGLTIKSTGNTSNAIIFDANRSGAGSSIGEIQNKWNGTTVSMIASQTGNDTTNKDDGKLTFYTSSANNLTERMRIESDGSIGFGTDAPFSYGGQNFEFKDTSSAQTGVRFSSSASSFEIGTDSNGGYLQAITPGDGIRFYTANSSAADITAMMFTSAGNVGIGTTGPATKLHVHSSNSPEIRATTNLDSNTPTMQIGYSTGSGYFLRLGDAANNEDVMIRTYGDTVFNGGNVGIGTTSASAKTHIKNSNASFGFLAENSNASYGTAVIAHTATSGTRYLVDFRAGSINPSDQVGTITTNGSTTAYNTSSDYRLKENVDYEFNALDRVAQLKPARFNFIADADTTVDGFLAHEVQDIVPEAISGEKDAVDDEGNPDYQGIDQSKLVPLLTKAIQELNTKLEAAEARITELEG